MDFLKKAMSGDKSTSSSSSGSHAQQPAGGGTGSHNANAATGTATGEKQDYGDKAFAALSKKFGKELPRDTQEKITDGIRGAYEKATGKKVDPKYSS